MIWIWPIFYGVNQKLFRTLMTVELFPKIASVKTLEFPRADAIRVTEQFLLELYQSRIGGTQFHCQLSLSAHVKNYQPTV